jgi:hypothetical protein
MNFHEVANIFPLMQGEEFEIFCQDVKDNGLIEAIWLHPDGRIIDGRNRYRACQEVGVEPSFRTWNGKGSLVDFVLSLNLHRRHLNSGQRAGIALGVEPHYAEEAKERQLAALKQNQTDKEKIPYRKEDQGQARDKAAVALGTNGRYVSDMKRIKRDAPQVFEQVMSAEITLTEAKEKTFKTDNNRPMKPKLNQAGSVYEPKGYDACQTPAYAIDPLLPYLDVDWVIWEPAAGENNLVEALYDSNYDTDQVVISDILTGQNFFEFKPEYWDCLITNPPYSIKYQWLERCYQLGKPFALLVPVEILGAKTAQILLKQYGFEMMLLNKRVDFKMPNKGWDSSAQFPVLWLCWQILPDKVMFGEINKNG